MSLVIFTSVCGLSLAPGHLHPFLSVLAIFAIAMGAGASGCLNMWYEAELDGRMQRTATRPLPRGVIEKDSALAFGLILGGGSVFVMGIAINYVAAALLAFTIFFYVVIYTMILKPRTAQNIVIGGVAGALPPVIGWAAVMGEVSVFPLYLFAIIFFWTIPHFWALALVKSDEYVRAGIPMMPAVNGVLSTKKQILTYAIFTVGASFLPLFDGRVGYFYALSSAFLGGIFTKLAIDLLTREKGGEMRLFAYSIFYLFLLFFLLVVDVKVLHG
jgi:protoheme IX farnesyltransferase